MNCKHVQSQMLDYAEKLLDQSVNTQIEAHLRQCAACTQEFQEIAQTLQLLQTTPFQEPPEAFWTDFTSRVMRQINTMEVPSPRRSLWSWFFLPRWKIAFVFVALFGLFGGGYWYFQAALRPGPQPVAPDEPLTTALRKIVPPDLAQDVLNTELALFDGTVETFSESDASDETLALLINSLTAEEKKAFLAELYKIRDATR
jgi:hypothetical protein